jgi:putative Holliday junction resolvase
LNYLCPVGRIMAFDFGGKRTGIAVTDPMKIIATGLETVSSALVITWLEKYLATEAVDLFVVGKPRQMDNSPSESAGMTDDFVKKLHNRFPQIPVERIDERFTSKMASRVIAQSGKSRKEKHNKALIDTVSATIILQSYMEAKGI